MRKYRWRLWKMWKRIVQVLRKEEKVKYEKREIKIKAKIEEFIKGYTQKIQSPPSK
jgi:hypothetical protein